MKYVYYIALKAINTAIPNIENTTKPMEDRTIILLFFLLVPIIIAITETIIKIIISPNIIKNTPFLVTYCLQCCTNSKQQIKLTSHKLNYDSQLLFLTRYYHRCSSNDYCYYYICKYHIPHTLKLDL